MGTVKAVLKHPEDLMSLVKMKVEEKKIKQQIPVESHWGFAYFMLQKVSRSFSLVIKQLGPELRNAVCIFYLVLRALDTVEDDTSIPVDIKVPILLGFHEHINDPAWYFSYNASRERVGVTPVVDKIRRSRLRWFGHIKRRLSDDPVKRVNALDLTFVKKGGTNSYKVLMDNFYLVSAAFMELRKSYQEAIEDIVMRMGAGMAKFICKEVDTIDDYDEYCHYVAGLVGLGLSKLFYASKLEDVSPDSLANSMGLFLQKTNIIRDYLEDINETPKSRMFWPRQIWSNYVDKLEDLKYEENAVKAVQCLNDMVTNALIHAEDCLKYMSALKNQSIFGFCAIPQIMAIGTLALCYNNVEVFRDVVKLRRGLAARISDQAKSMADVYGGFYDFCTILQSKVDQKDPNASLTLQRVNAIKKACISSGLLNKRRFYVDERRQLYSYVLILVIVLLSFFFAGRLMK